MPDIPEQIIAKATEALFEHFKAGRAGHGKDWPPPEQHLPWWNAAAGAVLSAVNVPAKQTEAWDDGWRHGLAEGERRGARRVAKAADQMAHVEPCIFPDNDCTCRVIEFREVARAALAEIEGGAGS